MTDKLVMIAAWLAVAALSDASYWEVVYYSAVGIVAYLSSLWDGSDA